MKLNPMTVESIFKDCLFADSEIVDGTPIGEYTKVEGISMKVGFHTGRLNSHKQEIIELLDELPDAFKEEVGGAGLFFKPVMTKTENCGRECTK